MGILSDFLVAGDEDARRYARRYDAGVAPETRKALAARLPLAEYKGLTDIELGALWSALEGVPWDADRHAFEQVETSDSTEDWLLRFPGVLVDLLVALSPEAEAPVLAEWAANEELDCDPAALKPVLDDLRRLAGLAKSRGQSLWLSGSL